jgi:hypothetical protein
MAGDDNHRAKKQQQKIGKIFIFHLQLSFYTIKTDNTLQTTVACHCFMFLSSK